MCVLKQGKLVADFIRRIKQRGVKPTYVCGCGKTQVTCIINTARVDGCKTSLTLSSGNRVLLYLICPHGIEKYYEIPAKYVKTHGFWLFKSYEILADWITKGVQNLFMVKENGIVTYKRGETGYIQYTTKLPSPSIYHALTYSPSPVNTSVPNNPPSTKMKPRTESQIELPSDQSNQRRSMSMFLPLSLLLVGGLVLFLKK